MSRGLGTMQRAILHVYDASVVSPPNSFYARHSWRDYIWLREEVARMLGAWCETYCFGELPVPLSHKPHLADWGHGSFSVAFARAMRTLIRRGIIVAGMWHSGPAPLGPLQRIAMVARVKCSEQF